MLLSFSVRIASGGKTASERLRAPEAVEKEVNEAGALDGSGGGGGGRLGVGVSVGDTDGDADGEMEVTDKTMTLPSKSGAEQGPVDSSATFEPLMWERPPPPPPP